MDKKNIIFSIIGTVVITGSLVGTAVGIYYALKPQNTSNNDNVPNINQANTQYTENYQQIFNISTPIMFVYEIGNNQNSEKTEIGFQSGTAWVFDKCKSQDKNLTTYYLATNLHVINLWSDANGAVNDQPISNVGLCIGKPKSQPFASNTMKDSNGEPNFKWKYTASHSQSVNLSEWYISNQLYNWDPISSQQTFWNEQQPVADPTTFSFYEQIYPYYPTNGNYSYFLYPQLGLIKNVDIGIIKLVINNNDINNFPFLNNFNQLLTNNGIENIYDLSTPFDQTFTSMDLSIGGFPVMQDNKYNYSVWNSWNSTNNPNNCQILEGNSGRGSIQYQNYLTVPNPSNTFYGVAENANLNHGSSGSMVFNNESQKIEGIYWGGLETSNKFSGRFIPFKQNNILSTWASLVKNNLGPLGTTYIYEYYFNSSKLNHYIFEPTNFLTINPFISSYLPIVSRKTFNEQ